MPLSFLTLAYMLFVFDTSIKSLPSKEGDIHDPVGNTRVEGSLNGVWLLEDYTHAANDDQPIDDPFFHGRCSFSMPYSV